MYRFMAFSQKPFLVAGLAATDLLVGPNRELLGPLFCCTIHAAALSGEFYVIESSNGEIYSCAVWFGAGVDLFDRSVPLRHFLTFGHLIHVFDCTHYNPLDNLQRRAAVSWLL